MRSAWDQRLRLLPSSPPCLFDVRFSHQDSTKAIGKGTGRVWRYASTLLLTSIRDGFGVIAKSEKAPHSLSEYRFLNSTRNIRVRRCPALASIDPLRVM